jgi:hypothetical protein
MKKHLLLFTVILLLVAGCGPSEEEIMAMTVAAYTPTPTNTPIPPTPTPLPFDVTLTIADEDGKPIAKAEVLLAELAEDEEQGSLKTDDLGKVSWMNLPGETLLLNVTAQGYHSLEKQLTIQRGENDITLNLMRDPNAILPSEACLPGETVYLIEDFEDGLAQGWNEITAAMQFNAQNGWSLETDENGNDYLTASGGIHAADSFQYWMQEMSPIGNAVWRMNITYTGTANQDDIFLNWRHSWHDGDWRYIVQFGKQVLLEMSRLEHPQTGHFSVVRTGKVIKQDDWHFFELGTYEDTTTLWVDGKRLANYTDPQPLIPGTFGLEVHLFEESDTVFAFDNFVVCEITGPFETMFILEE